MSYKKLSIGYYILLIYACAVASAYECSDYPDKDLIILLDESDNNVTYSEYMQNSDIPDDWAIASQEMFSDEDIKDYLVKNDPIVPEDYYDGVLSGIYWQKIQAGDNRTVYVIVETLNDSTRANKIYEKTLDAYRDSRGVIINFDTTGEYGQKGFRGQFKRDVYIIYFLDAKNRMIYVSGLNESDVEYVADRYNHLKNSLIVTESRHWKALVCKAGTDACTQTLYYSSVYDSTSLKECKTSHSGKDLPCPENRFERFSNSVKIPFASCEKGDILELSYLKRSEFPMNNRFWSTEDFYFENQYPSEYMLFRLTLPESLEINHFATQGLNPVPSRSAGYKSYTWTRVSVPPFEEESLMPPVREAIARAGYSSILSWDDIKEWYGGLFQESLDKDSVKEKTVSLIAGSNSDEEKIKKIYEWVRDEIRYEENEIGFLTGYKPHKCEEILDYKFGDCKDHTVILISMLDSAGIKSYPVLVGRDAINMGTPSPYEFYHSMVAVPKDGGFIWLDPTCSYCPYGYLSSGEQGADVLMLLNPGVSFAKTPVSDSDRNYKYHANYSIALGAAGDAEINVSLWVSGSSGLSLKEKLNGANEDKVKETLNGVVKNVCPEFELIGHNITNSSTEGLQMELFVRCRHFATKTEKKLVYNIPADSIYSDVISKDKRRFAIVTEDNEEYHLAQTIILPDGYSVNLLPGRYSAKESFADYVFECLNVSGAINCIDELDVKEVNLPASEYALFKDYYTKINSLKRSIILVPEETAPAQEGKTKAPSQEPASPSGDQVYKEAPSGDISIKEREAGPLGSNVLLFAIIGLLLAVIAFLVMKRK